MIVDTKYIGLISLRLKNFKKKNNNIWNCSCPICGDSKKDERKARGYFLPYKGKMMYKCHNCGIALPFSAFLKRFDQDLYKEYRMEKFGGRRTRIKKKIITAPKMSDDKMKKLRSNSKFLDELIPFDKMPEEIKKYLLGRGISGFHLKKYFFYTDKFKAFSNLVCPGTFKEESLKYDEARIIIVFFNEDGEFIGFQGREIEKSYAKYITIKVNSDEKKIFGLDRIDPSKMVYVVEGPIDSLFIDNCIAACGADLVSQTRGMYKRMCYIFDNEPRSEIICKKIATAIKDGLNVVIFPSNVHEKDINDIVLSGIDIDAIIKSNTFNKLKAKLAFSKWKRCDI
jgi:hypothetical protein